MNESEEFEFSGNGNDFMPQHFMNNSNNQLSFFQSGKNSDISGNSEFQMRTETHSKRIRTSPDHILQEGDQDSISKEPSLLDLKLTKTTSFLSEWDKICLSKRKKPRKENEGSSSSHEKTKAKTDEEKLKAGNFPATYIKIGAWQRMARHEGDLVVKLYYAKQKLVWEVLDGPLKSKMEIQWSDICAIRATTPENEQGILEIELIRPPVYYRETCPQPRKHTLWQQSSDFTGGQAPIWRRHHLTFSPGILNKNYEKLLQCDKRLDALSKNPFRSHESPYFDPTLFGTTLNFSGYGANKTTPYPYRAYSTIIPREPLFRATPNPSLSVMDLPFTYQGGRNYNFAAQNQGSWHQGISNPRDNFGIHGTFGIPSTTNNNNNDYDPSFPSPSFPSATNENNFYDPSFPSTTNDNNNFYDPSFPSTTNDNNNVYDPSFPSTTNNNNVYDPSYYDPASGHLTDIQTDLLNSVQLHNALPETVGSTSSLLEPMGVNNIINEPYYHPDMAFHAITGDQGSSSSSNNYDLNGMILDPSHWLTAQGSSDNVFQGSGENVFQGGGDNVFQGSSQNVFQGAGENVFQSSNENVFQGASDNMFQDASDNMFELQGNNPMNIGVGGFFNNLSPF